MVHQLIRQATLHGYSPYFTFFRLCIGAVATTMAFNTETWWALPIVLVVMITGLLTDPPHQVIADYSIMLGWNRMIIYA